ncbi:MAG: hypothetical protein FDZ70_00085 [Actinobacteria bacterium]|nr:MAG: hypothetical protein FDZ70_00085 [Actinomycetota bacterium]
MPRPTLARRITAVLLATLMLLVSAGFTWAVADDYVERDTVPAGVRIGEVALGSLNADEARAVIDAQVAAPLLEPVTVSLPGTETALTLDPKEMLTVDIDGMVSDAVQPKRDASLAQRVYRRLSGEPVDYEVKTLLAVDEGALGAWVDGAAAESDRPAIDSTLTVGEGTLTVQPDVSGYRTRKADAVASLAAALKAGEKENELVSDEITPTVTDDGWGKTILVDKSQRRLWLYNGATLERTYRVAIGTPGYPTPEGWWKVINKRRNPSWSNPAPNGWGASMPAYIAPGPGNPLGTRALDLNAAGIRFHGTNKRWSVGTAASHGCMRMLREDIEALFEVVPVGTRVIIVP